MIGSPERVKIQRSSKLKTVLNGKILALNSKNVAISEFSRYIEYDFLNEGHKNNFHTKNQEDSSQQCLEVKGQKPSKLSILAKNDQILAISEFSQHIHYDFLKENHKGSSHTKNQKNLQRRLEDIGSKVHFLAKKGFFGYKKPPGGSKKIFDPFFFTGHRSGMET